jgi:hypothetical protein
MCLNLALTFATKLPASKGLLSRFTKKTVSQASSVVNFALKQSLVMVVQAKFNGSMCRASKQFVNNVSLMPLPSRRHWETNQSKENGTCLFWLQKIDESINVGNDITVTVLGVSG